MPIELEWSNHLNIGVERFDLQHRELLARIREIKTEFLAGNDREKQKQNISALYSLAENHFRDEENALEGKEYPEIFDHLDEHRNLLTELAAIQDLHASGSISIDEEIIGFLANWLVVHTQETDRGYVHLFT